MKSVTNERSGSPFRSDGVCEGGSGGAAGMKEAAN